MFEHLMKKIKNRLNPSYSPKTHTWDELPERIKRENIARAQHQNPNLYFLIYGTHIHWMPASADVPAEVRVWVQQMVDRYCETVAPISGGVLEQEYAMLQRTFPDGSVEEISYEGRGA